MADLSKVAEERRSPLARREEKPVEEAPAEDMLSADVVFPKKSEDKKED
jgi:hypothetical protein